ncbi:MAG: glycosyltransferase, partial [Deltaproteobacteria bacterium]
MTKEKLLFVITKLELGGAQKHVLDVLRSLDREQFELFLYTAREGLLVDEALSLEGVTVRRSRFLERPINPLKDLLALIELFRYIAANRFDIVHTHSSKAGILGRLAARFSGVRTVVHTVHGWSFNDLQPAFVRMLYRRLERLCANFTSTI